MSALKLIKKYGAYLISSGDKFDIISAININGKSPFFEYFSKLYEQYMKNLEKGKTKRDKVNKNYTTLGTYFEKFCNHGPWSNEHQIKHLGEGFYEFKKVDTGLRVPFYYDAINRNVIILTHYFEKKKQKTPQKELKKMKVLKKQFEEYRKMEVDNVKI